MADIIDRGVIEIVGDATKLRASIEDAKKSIRTLGEGQKDISKSASASIDKYIGRLQAQNATFGKSNREIELYKLRLRGASNEQINVANAALKIAEANERTSASMRKMTADAARFGAIAGTAIAAGLTSAAVAFEVLIGKAAAFKDLGEKVGDTGANIASLSVAAAVGGASIETVSQAAIRLTKNLTGVDNEADDAGAAIKALGLDLAQFKNLAPTDQLEAVAKALAEFEEGPKKAAVAMALFGKAGAELLPFLKELAGETGRQNILTQEQIDLADEYKDKQAALIAQFSLQAQAIAADLIPAYTDLQQAFFDTIKGIIGIDDEADQLARSTAIRDFADSAAKSIAVVIDGLDLLVRAFQVAGKTIGAYAASMEALQRLDFKAAISSIKSLGEDVKKITDRPLFSTNLETRRNARQDTTGDDRIRHTPVRGELKFEGKAKKATGAPDTSRQDAAAQLQFDLAAIKAANDAEADAFRNAEQIMQALRSAALVDDQAYFASKLGFINSFARTEEAAIQAQIERRQREVFSGKDALKDQLDNAREIEKLQAQIVKIRADAVTKTTINAIEEQAAIKKVQQAYTDAKDAADAYLATIARRNAREIEGIGRGQRFRDANAARGDIDDRAAEQRRRLEGELRRGQITRQQFEAHLQIAEETYSTEVSLYEDRSRRLDELQRDWLTGAEEAFNNYIDMTRDTAAQFEAAFTKSFSSIEDFIGELTTGGIRSLKDLGQAVNKLALGIAADFAKIEIREKITGPLAELVKEKLPDIGGIFGKARPQGQTPPFIDERHAAEIAKRFKGSVDVPVVEGSIAKAGEEAANAATFTTAVTTAGTTFATEATAAGTALATETTAAGTAFAAESVAAGASITAAAASFAASVTAAGSAFAASVASAGAAGGGAGGIVDLLGDFALDSFATGTPYVPQTGPYLLHQGERVVPAAQNQAGGGMSLVINQSFAPGTNSETVTQAAVRTGREVRLAQARGFSG